MRNVETFRSTFEIGGQVVLTEDGWSSYKYVVSGQNAWPVLVKGIPSGVVSAARKFEDGKQRLLLTLDTLHFVIYAMVLHIAEPAISKHESIDDVATAWKDYGVLHIGFGQAKQTGSCDYSILRTSIAIIAAWF